MARIILKILTISLLLTCLHVHSQEIWRESFTVPDKGITGDENGTVQADFTGVDTWTLEYASVVLSDAGDYAKTVSTSGGRFEGCDTDGEVVWRSEPIAIAGYEDICIELTAAETGSGTNTITKYLKACYCIDGDEEKPFSQNGLNSGNWGSVKARQEGLSGNSLRIICYLSTHYAADKVILDEVAVWAEQGPLPPVNPGDVVINEIMADPVPPVGLPEVEYLELYNRRDFAVSTENWMLRINGVAKKLQTNLIQPGGYLLLCAAGAPDSLSPFGLASSVPGFPGLLNKGAEVEILDGGGRIIDRIVYSGEWYCDEAKSDGGWSLERIDPGRNCNQPGNWKASNHTDGGTPGSRNSIFDENKDKTSPYVKWAAAISGNEVEVAFSEPIDTTLLCDINNFLITELGNPDRIELVNGQQVVLHFRQGQQSDKIYNLEISGLADECSNQLPDLHYKVQWNILMPGDVLINEILFNPYPGAEDYVEIYNRSEKLIDLSRLLLANRNNELELNQKYELAGERRILFPGEYLALTSDTGSVFSWYPVKCRQCFLQMDRVPAYSNDEGRVVLLNRDTMAIDELYYNENMHSPFLADVEGISLERISISEDTNTPANWHSAAGDAGYGTPGYVNSQAGQELQGKPDVVFEPDAFSPNADGYNDIYTIYYRMSNPGYVANVKVFDAAGRFIRHLVKNELLGTTGSLTWNGEDETGQRLPLGMYIVFLELFNEKGEVYKYKDGVVLTDVFQ